LERLKDFGVEIVETTLHVGIDTFRPIQVEDIQTHQMHGEYCEITAVAAEKICKRKGRLIAVGTTSVRTLETLTDAEGVTHAGITESKIFITPGYQFKAVDGMFTNFHLPKTTMLLMISALAGRESVLSAYTQAVNERYRFLSFGDSMMIV
jgi:S-adenosylmethionine:tRNA ribosyltransferase-isomerase